MHEFFCIDKIWNKRMLYVSVIRICDTNQACVWAKKWSSRENTWRPLLNANIWRKMSLLASPSLSICAALAKCCLRCSNNTILRHCQIHHAPHVTMTSVWVLSMYSSICSCTGFKPSLCWSRHGLVVNVFDVDQLVVQVLNHRKHLEIGCVRWSLYIYIYCA